MAKMTVTGGLIVRCQYGISAIGPGAEVEVKDVIIRDTTHAYYTGDTEPPPVEPPPEPKSSGAASILIGAAGSLTATAIGRVLGW